MISLLQYMCHHSVDAVSVGIYGTDMCPSCDSISLYHAYYYFPLISGSGFTNPYDVIAWIYKFCFLSF